MTDGRKPFNLTGKMIRKSGNRFRKDRAQTRSEIRSLAVT